MEGETCQLNEMNKKDIFVIIPGLNEQKYISKVLKKVGKFTQNIIVVDDGSTDKMARLARKYTPHVLSHAINLGKGAALKTGCEYAFTVMKAQAVIFMDSDDQHHPKHLQQFESLLQHKHQVVFGVRAFDSRMPLFRIMLNRLASVLILFLFGDYIPDIPSGYKALTRKAYKRLKWDATDYAVEMEIAAKTAKYNIKFATIPIETIYHDFDRGMTILDTMRMMTKIVRWKISL